MLFNNFAALNNENYDSEFLPYMADLPDTFSYKLWKIATAEMKKTNNLNSA